jgi:outer membrane protein OmpU
VFISGAFGKLSMGDVDGAATAAVGHVDGVGLTGLSDLNEMTYFANGGDFGTSDPTALYEYSMSALSVYLSSTDPAVGDSATAIGAKYAINDMFTVSAGYENYDAGGGNNDTQYILGANVSLGAVVLKVRYADSNFDTQQTAVSATYTMDALAVTGFYMDNTQDGYEAYGLGASYDLGGGAKVIGGYVTDEISDTDAFDLGLSFSF